jgi:hypothetical protein
MPLINLKTVYTSATWTQDGDVAHTDYTPNEKPESLGQKFNLVPGADQYQFYQNNRGNIALDQIKSLSAKNGGLGIGTLKTDYTKLKFGKDQPNGGSSGQPFITSNPYGVITTPDGTILVNNTGDPRSLFTDWPIRGGVYPSNQIDSKRIEAFLKTTKGAQFIDKQKVLQFMNPKIETAVAFLDASTNNVIPGLIENTRVYSEKGLLNQVSIQGTGLHVSRDGTPTLGVFQEFYADTVGLQNVSNSSALNRLDLLRKLKIVGLQNISTSTFNSIANITLAKRLGIALTPFAMFNYSGGPTSSDRQPNTIIGRYTDTTLVSSDIVMGYAQLAAQKPFQDNSIDNYKDFRRSIPAYGNGSSVTWINSLSQEKRIGVINAGKIIKGLPHGKQVDYTIGVASDKLNMLGPKIQNQAKEIDPWKELGYKDSIKLGFECMSNDNTSKSTALLFRALLSNGFTDNNSAVLNAFRYAGRGDELFTYQGFTRAISFSFKIAAFSRDELKPLYNKLNYLISQVYPDYSGTTGVMRAPLVKVTLGDYLYRVPGFLESVNVTVDNTTPWEINLEGSKNRVQELPHVLEIAISFKPIHNVLPERSIYKEINSRTTINNPYNTLSNYGALNTQVDNVSRVNEITPLIGNSENNFITKTFESATPAGLQTPTFDSNYTPIPEPYSIPKSTVNFGDTLSTLEFANTTTTNPISAPSAIDNYGLLQLLTNNK